MVTGSFKLKNGSVRVDHFIQCKAQISKLYVIAPKELGEGVRTPEGLWGSLLVKMKF